MEQTKNKPLAYPFVFEIGRNHSYAFETENHVFYEVKFKHFDYFFKTEVYKHKSYEFTIEILLNPYQQLPPQDPRIQPTIAAIILNFFDTINLPIVLYVCDSSDGRQLVRSRLFSVWFTEYQTPDMAKIDTTLRDKNGEEVPISLILQTTNPYRSEIVDEFFKTIGGYHK